MNSRSATRGSLLAELAAGCRTAQAALTRLVRAKRAQSQALLDQTLERSGADQHRHIRMNLVLAGILGAAILEVVGAFPAAQAFGLGQGLTDGVTLLLIAAVIGGALLIVHSTGLARTVFSSLMAIVVISLFLLRLRFLEAVGGSSSLLGALIEAAALTLITLIVLAFSHELWRRAEPLSLWGARRRLSRAERELRQADALAIEATQSLRRTRSAFEHLRRHPR
jgi:hypothetical protein